MLTAESVDGLSGAFDETRDIDNGVDAIPMMVRSVSSKPNVEVYGMASGRNVDVIVVVYLGDVA